VFMDPIQGPPSRTRNAAWRATTGIAASISGAESFVSRRPHMVKGLNRSRGSLLQRVVEAMR
jgi:hypothetical protein